jgi:CRP/FNR family transcriptional regulator, cyclic AMP receptor protein
MKTELALHRPSTTATGLKTILMPVDISPVRRNGDRATKRGGAKRVPCAGAKVYSFFAHIAFAYSAGAHSTPQRTVNLLIEVPDRAVSASLKKALRRVALQDSQKAELAGEIAMTATLDYLKSENEFRQFPARRFVNFDLVRPTYISVRPPPDKVLHDGSSIWRVEENDTDKLRGEPLSVRYPDIEKRLAAHPFLKGMSQHHIEVLALCATPTDFDEGQTIFLEDEPASGFYLIETGKVALEKKARDGTRVIIDTVSAGEPLGWSWLFAPYLWHFDARAAESGTAICLSGLLLRQHRDDDLTLSHELFKRTSEVMVRRLQAARRKLASQK